MDTDDIAPEDLALKKPDVLRALLEVAPVRRAPNVQNIG